MTANTVLGWEVPPGSFPCWVISEKEKNEAVKSGSAFHNHKPSCYFALKNRLDNNFIEGYLGHTNFGGAFHFDMPTSYTYFSDFQNRNPVYFSFDRVSLYRLVEIHPTRPLTFILKRVDPLGSFVENTAFMVMPFKEKKLNDFFTKSIRPFLETEMKIRIYRADDFNGNDVIIDTIYKQIEEAEFVIADTSFANKNAFYEFGYAAAKEKEIITIQNLEIEENLFFDRAHIRAIFYSYNKVEEFQKELKNSINSIRQKVQAKS